MTPSQPITFIPGDSPETALYVDHRAGYAQALPGHPALHLPDGDDSCDAMIQLADIPVQIYYQLQEVQPTDKPDVQAQTMAVAFGFNRSGSWPEVTPSWPQHVAMWGAGGGASVLYDLPEPDAAGYDAEEVMVLVRGAQAMVITKRLKAAEVGWLSWALFSSAANGAILWRPDELPSAAPNLWPESLFLLPGVRGKLTAKQEANVPDLAALMSGITLDLDELAERFSTFILGNDPPWLTLTENMRETFAMYLLDIVEHDDLRQVILHGLHEHSHTMHDLRGMAIAFLRAIEQVHQMPLPE